MSKINYPRTIYSVYTEKEAFKTILMVMSVFLPMFTLVNAMVILAIVLALYYVYIYKYLVGNIEPQSSTYVTYEDCWVCCKYIDANGTKKWIWLRKGFFRVSIDRNLKEEWALESYPH